TPRDDEWLGLHLAGVDVVLQHDTTDALRPWHLRTDRLVPRGVRVALVAATDHGREGDGDRDTEVHRLAWRHYVATAAERTVIAAECATGDLPVRVLGAPRHDRLVQPGSRATALRRRLGNRPVV